jgi:hypothetical protein
MIADMERLDRNLKLLAGDSFAVDNFEIKPMTVREVKDVGFIKYNHLLGILSFKVEDLLEHVPNGDLSIFEVILYSGNTELIDIFLDALCFFLRENKEELVFHKDVGLLFGGVEEDLRKSRIMNGSNFNEFLQVIKFQNCLNGKTDEYKPNGDLAKSIIDKLKKAKEIVNRKKGNAEPENTIDFFDLVSAVSTKSNTYNKHTVWDLTMFQFYDEYKRLERITSFETNILAMVQGAKIELQHWSTKIE